MNSSSIKQIFIALLSFTMLVGWIDSASDKNEEGIQLFNEQAYDEAISKFADAQLHLPKSDSLDFNIATTHYQGGKLPEAEKAYKRALGSKDVSLKAKANYNMGNTLFKQGKLNEALDFYKKTIELTEKRADKKDDEIKGLREDAKYNYEFVQKKMEEMKQEQQEQEEQEKQDQEEEEKQEEQKQGEQPPEEKDPEEQEQKKDQEQEKKDEKKEDKGSQNGQQKEQSPEEEKQESPSQPQEKKEMTKEEAERILDALRQSEESAREMQEKENESAQYETEKNW